jgi:hypothetical protein
MHDTALLYNFQPQPFTMSGLGSGEVNELSEE